jgi:hypothetical protein
MVAGRKWSDAEELAVFDEARTILADNPRYPSKNWLHRQIANKLNGRFTRPFHSSMVKAKLYHFREKWRSQGNIAVGDRELVFAPLLILSLPHSSI